MRISFTALCLASLLALLGLSSSLSAQFNSAEVNGALAKRGRVELKQARKSMKLSESSFKLKLRAFEIDLKSGGDADELLTELALDLADLQADIHEAVTDAREALMSSAAELLDNLDVPGALPGGAAPGAGRAVDKLREELLRFAEKQRRRILKRLGRSRKIAGGKPELRLSVVLLPLDPREAQAVGAGEILAANVPAHSLRWMIAGGLGEEGGGRILAGGGRSLGAPLPSIVLASSEGPVAVAISGPSATRWALEAGAGDPLPAGNYLLQLGTDAIAPGPTAAIGLR